MKLVRRASRTGSTAPARIGGYRKPLLDGQEALLRELTAAELGITLAEIRAARTKQRAQGPFCTCALAPTA